MKSIYRFSQYILMLIVMLSYGCRKDKIPVILTSEITSITRISAIGGGTITEEGSDAIISRGVCWSTFIFPTIADKKTQDGPGAGTFSSNITGLDGGTTYYVRAYATSSAGTGYGTLVSFKTTGLTQMEEIKIQNYVNSNPALSFQLKPSGLYYSDRIIGTGLSVASHDIAYVKYTGKFFDGTVFDTNVGTPDTLIFPVNEGWLIPGFDEGVLYMKEGGKALFLLPSNLAYGETGFYSYVPGNTPILFEVDLVKLKKVN
jgi:hypothetical protein